MARLDYLCPICRNTDHPTGANFCKICGTKIIRGGETK